MPTLIPQFIATLAISTRLNVFLKRCTIPAIIGCVFILILMNSLGNFFGAVGDNSKKIAVLRNGNTIVTSDTEVCNFIWSPVSAWRGRVESACAEKRFVDVRWVGFTPMIIHTNWFYSWRVLRIHLSFRWSVDSLAIKVKGISWKRVIVTSEERYSDRSCNHLKLYQVRLPNCYSPDSRSLIDHDKKERYTFNGQVSVLLGIKGETLLSTTPASCYFCYCFSEGPPAWDPEAIG